MTVCACYVQSADERPLLRGMTVEAVAHSVSPGIFMQGPGGILAVPLCERYGRFVISHRLDPCR